MKVWDLFVRLAHWTLVAAVLGAWLTAEADGDTAKKVHEWLGYLALGVLALRIPWGWIGTRYARFSQFVRAPAQTLAYAKTVASGSERRYIGHNPLGAWMILALIVMVIAASASGWLYITDRFWGEEWLEEIHEALANIVLTLVVLHVAGVIFSSLRHRENLVRAMFTGRKRPPGPGDVA